MPDDLHDLDAVLRRAKAALDGQTPAGYFEALPGRTLARLDDPAIGPAIAASHDDDSGLKDIRDLASETRARLSSRRTAQGALRPAGDAGLGDDAAGSSSVWKAVAVPELADPAVPQGVAIAAASAASAAASAASAAASPASVAAASVAAAADRAPAAAGEAPAAAAIPSAPAGVAQSLPAPARPRGGRRRTAWIALAGAGLAAAGAVIYFSAGDGAKQPAPTAANADRNSVASSANPASSAAAVAPSGGPADEHSAAPTTTRTDAVAAEPAPSAGVARSENRTADAIAPPSSPAAGVGPGHATAVAPGAAIKSKKYPPAVSKQLAAGKPAPKPIAPGAPSQALGKLGAPTSASQAAAPTADPATTASTTAGQAAGAPTGSQAAGSASGGAEPPPLDELIGESGAAKPAPARPKLERTSLSGDDIKRGMSAVAGKAAACFAGTQGLAKLRLTVAPSGRVVKATVTGMFAGSPAGACVERAASTARFPAWDGGPQSFNYSYLLSD